LPLAFLILFPLLSLRDDDDDDDDDAAGEGGPTRLESIALQSPALAQIMYIGVNSTINADVPESSKSYP
jgi:hypothetical protein